MDEAARADPVDEDAACATPGCPRPRTPGSRSPRCEPCKEQRKKDTDKDAARAYRERNRPTASVGRIPAAAASTGPPDTLVVHGETLEAIEARVARLSLYAAETRAALGDYDDREALHNATEAMLGAQDALLTALQDLLAPHGPWGPYTPS